MWWHSHFYIQITLLYISFILNSEVYIHSEKRGRGGGAQVWSLLHPIRLPHIQKGEGGGSSRVTAQSLLYPIRLLHP